MQEKIGVSETKSKLLGELKAFEFDIAHDQQHIENVLQGVNLLQGIYGGNARILSVAAVLHDIGRSDSSLHGEESRLRSVALAEPILERNDFSPQEICQVCQVILDHDQPDKRPESLEGRILKDADFLDGFGARGILRVIIWTIKSGGSYEDIIHRLKVKMPQRIASLEFPESREIARKNYTLVETFLRGLGVL